jgi:hypothetical protein
MAISSAHALAEAHEAPGERGEGKGERDEGEIHHDDDSRREGETRASATLTTSTSAKHPSRSTPRAVQIATRTRDQRMRKTWAARSAESDETVASGADGSLDRAGVRYG